MVLGTQQRHEPVTQVRAPGEEFVASRGASQARMIGDPLAWVLRREPQVIEEDLPESIWRPHGPRRTHP